MPFDFDTLHTFIEKANKTIDWIAEEMLRQKNWRSLLVLIDVVLFLALNPFQWPFPNLLTPFSQLLSYGWYRPAFWSLVSLIFISAVIVAARAKRNPTETGDLKPGAIKGLLPFGYEDAEDFAHLQRGQNLRECLQSIGDDHWRFGVLSGESGAGKTSFLRAGLWPALEKRKARCVYVKFSDLDPFESVRRACRKHLPACSGTADDADFLSLLRGATAQDSSPVVLLFDQFEQFFVHRKRKIDRAMFVQALTQWFADMESLPVKLLICVRGDFLDRLTELHKAMKYSLGPTQDFRLERFEPDQATEVICFLAEKEGLEYDRKFISEMARQELADTEDSLISPVDVQVLARMIQRQTAQEGRAFNRSTFQKLGGVEGLLNRYLTSTLETRGTQARRQTAVKVLLALTDLERNARAGALTTEAIREKLGVGGADADLKESIFWLQRGDVRLISPSSENEEDKFELAHERRIPALRRLAGKQLGDAERAEQLLDRRTNEWLGNKSDSRYLFSIRELFLIRKQMSFITWGSKRRAKEELIAASKRRYKLRAIALALIILLAITYPRIGILFQPIYDLRLVGVPIEYRGLSPGVKLVGDPEQMVSVRLSGPRDIVRSLTPNLLLVVADLSGKEPGERVVQLKVDENFLPDNVTVMQIEPQSISIKLEPSVTKRVRVEAQFEGRVAEGWEIYGVELHPSEVEIEGPKSVVNKMERVLTEIVSLDGRHSDLQRSVDVEVPEASLRVKTPGPIELSVKIRPR